LKFIELLEKENVFDKPIVTEIKMATEFFEAELEHQNYYSTNKEQPYCQWVIQPKIEKLEKYFYGKLS